MLVLASVAALTTTATARQQAPSPATQTWVQRADPVVTRTSSGDNIASDPSVVVEADGGYLMVYSGPSRRHTRSTLIAARSRDGVHWRDVRHHDGVVLEGTPGRWDAFIETSELLVVDGRYLLFYAGYPDEDTGTGTVTHGQLGLATSTDGVHFRRVSPRPVMATSRRGLDQQAIFSPTIVKVGRTLWMLYTGWKGDGGQLLGARSRDLGRTWTKVTTGPVFEPSDAHTYMNNSTDEADIVKAPGGGYDLYFTAGSLGSVPMDSIGVAHSARTPFGPWTLRPRPVVTGTVTRLWQSAGIGFPAVVHRNGVARMWFTGIGVDLSTGIEPLPVPVFSIGYAHTR